MQMLMQGITLTEKQQASVDSIGKVYRAQMPPMQQGTPPDSATRAKGMAVRQKQYAAVRSVLTPDQQKVFDKNLEDMRAQMAKPRRSQRYAADAFCSERPLVGGVSHRRGAAGLWRYGAK
jgi:Spy/CpxP family protein refolding chaperone